MAKKRANRNKSLDISEATRRATRRAARGDRNEGEGEQAQRDVRTFLIYERAYFLGLLHMDISSGTERAEADARIGRATPAWNFNACTFLFPPRCPILSFFSFFFFSPSSPLRNCSRQPHLDTCDMMYYDHAWKVEESKGRGLIRRTRILETLLVKVLRKDNGSS